MGKQDQGSAPAEGARRVVVDRVRVRDHVARVPREHGIDRLAIELRGTDTSRRPRPAGGSGRRSDSAAAISPASGVGDCGGDAEPVRGQAKGLPALDA
jgi:hypothetical protein